ncbi:MAG: DnaJ domain-containing protein [Rubripirellula sp.]
MPDQDNDQILDPFAVLGIDPASTTEQIRARYLELVRENPPERDAHRFAQIREAYEMASDPISRWTRRLYTPELSDPDTLIEQFRQRPQRFTTDALIRAGEQLKTDSDKAK